MNCSMLKVMRTSFQATPAAGGRAPRKMGFGQKVVVLLLLTVVLVPPLAGFYSYFSGVPLHLLASGKDEKDNEAVSSAAASVTLVAGQAHTLAVSDEVAATLGIRKGEHESIAVAQPPKMMRPLVLPGSTMLDPTHLARIRARFAPARVVEIAHVRDPLRKSGQTEFRELRQGDSVSKGDLLGIFYSLDVGSKKNDLLDALVQLELDQNILDNAQNAPEAVPEVFMLECRACRAGRPQRRQPGHQQPQAVGDPPGGDRRASCRGQEDLFRQERVVQDPRGPVGEGRETSRRAPRLILTRRLRTPGAG